MIDVVCDVEGQLGGMVRGYQGQYLVDEEEGSLFGDYSKSVMHALLNLKYKIHTL